VTHRGIDSGKSRPGYQTAHNVCKILFENIINLMRNKSLSIFRVTADFIEGKVNAVLGNFKVIQKSRSIIL
jgi:hypothetical protein